MLRARDRAGFTLIEVLLVLGIIASVALIALPRYAASAERYRLDAAAQRVIADMAFARGRARASGVSVTVRFDTALDHYRLLDVPNVLNGAASYTVELDQAPYEARIVSATFDDSEDAVELVGDVIFDPWGAPDSGGAIVLTVGDRTRTLVLDPDGGTLSEP